MSRHEFARRCPPTNDRVRLVLRAVESLGVNSRKGRQMREIMPGVTIDPEIHHGKPVITGTRVPVEVVLGHLAAGMSSEEVETEYGLKRDDILAALRYATEIVSSEEVRLLG